MVNFGSWVQWVLKVLLPPPRCRAQGDTGGDGGTSAVKRTLKDEIVRLTNVRASAKIRSV